MTPAFDIRPFLHQDEGQHFDRGRRDSQLHIADRGELGTDRGERRADRGERRADRGELAPDRGELTPDRGELLCINPAGLRPRKLLPAHRTNRHWSSVVNAGRLERRFSETPTHAEQAGRSTGFQMPLGFTGKDQE